MLVKESDLAADGERPGCGDLATREGVARGGDQGSPNRWEPVRFGPVPNRPKFKIQILIQKNEKFSKNY